MVTLSCKRKPILFALAIVLAVFAAANVHAEPWRFGVMADTQWAAVDDGKSPNTVAVGIIDQINREFIKAGVRFVIQVGDLADVYSDSAMDTRASAAAALYRQGIGFFPLRGNHDDPRPPANPVAAAQYFRKIFPQTRGAGPHLFGASNFSSPREGLSGLSYSFDFDNARFILLDEFTAVDGKPNRIANQQSWISDSLFNRPDGGHVFVFGHRNLIGQSHTGTIFGKTPSDDPAGQNAFIGSLHFYGARYYISGHDHIHNRSLIKSPDGLSEVQQIICASASSKFYIPANPSPDRKYNRPPREVLMSQEVNTIGYYIFTVDGPHVSVAFFSAAVAPSFNEQKRIYTIRQTPDLRFTRKETLGYSLQQSQPR
ncbi:MAG: metallophosphoesterase [Syntrophobacteraceae bacterium]